MATPDSEIRLVTLIRRSRKNPSLIEIHIDGEHTCTIDQNQLADLGIATGDEIDGQEVQRLLRSEQSRRGRDLLVRFVSRKLRSVREARRRLERENLDAAIEEVLDWGLEVGLLNDLRFAEAFASDASRLKKLGPLRIRQGLRRAGIEPEIVDQVLQDWEGEHAVEDAVRELARKRWRQLRHVPDDMRKRKRVFDYLRRRGYPTGLIMDALDAVKAELDEED